MKTIKAILILAICLLFSQCSKEKDEIVNEDIICSDIFANIEKPVTNGGKGWILFSWKENNHRNYSIVLNMNISPANERISENNIMKNDSCLLCNLASFDEGVEVIWIGSGKEDIMGKQVQLSYPDAPVINKISNYCLLKNIDLVFE